MFNSRNPVLNTLIFNGFPLALQVIPAVTGQPQITIQPVPARQWQLLCHSTVYSRRDSVVQQNPQTTTTTTTTLPRLGMCFQIIRPMKFQSLRKTRNKNVT